MTVKKDNAARDLINEKKKDFYTSYAYLKPECEKSNLKKIADKMKSAATWCKDHWKQILIAVEIAVAVVCLFIPGLQVVSLKILSGIAIGALAGVLIGGAFGAASGYAQFGKDGILPGIIDGAKDGLFFGAALGGLGGAGMAVGKLVGCGCKFIGTMQLVHTVSSKLAIGMLAFDTTSLGYNVQERLIQDKKANKRLIPSFIGEPISDLNEKAHNNPFYNALQNITFAVAAFSGGYVSEAACFVAGTLVATACGLRAIETIRAGDMVLSANAETMETGYKPVVETYVRKVDKLVHLTVDGEEIITTVDHPFYVNEQGFVHAVDLCIGSELVDSAGSIRKVERIFREKLLDETCDVYNFKVDEWHTYFVGDNNVLVHNAQYDNSGIITDGSQFDDEGNLKPNVKYQSGEHEYIYETDQNGFIKEVKAEEIKPKIHSGRLKHESKTPGKIQGDDAGHLIADRNGGSPKIDNVISQGRHLNRSDYKKMENHINQAIAEGQKVTDFNIRLENSPSGRPTSIDVDYNIDGELFSYRFKQ